MTKKIGLLILALLLIMESSARAVEEDSRFKLTYNGIKKSVVTATISPAFYIPAGLALITFYEDIGRNASEETRENHPLWGDQERASDASDNLRTLSSVAMISSSLLFVPKGLKYVFSNLAFDVAASFGATTTRALIRDGNRRSRPNGNEASFPSGHATAAGARVALANYNIFQSDLNSTTKYLLAGFNWSIAYMTGYSRVESHNHYPEDVLAGIAIGYWVTNVLKMTFTNTRRDLAVSIIPYGDRSEVGLQTVVSF